MRDISTKRCHRLSRSVVVVTVFFAAIAAADASAQPPGEARVERLVCKEDESKTKAALTDATDLVLLMADKARPTFAVQLASATSGRDGITFFLDESRLDEKARVAAEMTRPRFKGTAVGGKVDIGARPHPNGSNIFVQACFENLPQYAAGRYEGTVHVYGPKIADFYYAIVVTTKWPRWIAVLAILLTFLGCIVVAFFTDVLVLPGRKESLTSNKGERLKGYVTLVFAGVFAIGLAALSYWSVYASNETWGSDPPSDLTALVSAAFAAAIGGLITARKLLLGSS